MYHTTLTLRQDLFVGRLEDFSSMFRRILSLTLDRTLPTVIRTQLVCFLIHAFQSLDCAIVRKECAPLVSIGLWQNLCSEKLREGLLDQNPQLRKTWRASQRRFDAADDSVKARLRFDRSWLYSMLLDFLNMLQDSKIPGSSPLALLEERTFLLTLSRLCSILREIH